MALSGSLTGSGKIYWQDSNNYKTLVFSWSATQSIENNTTTISWSLTYTGNTGGYVSGVNWSVALGAVSGTLTGTTSGSGSQDFSGTSGTLKTGTAVLSALENGTSSFSVSFSGTPAGTSHTCSGSTSWTIDQIPRNDLIFVKVGGQWKSGIPYVKVNGVWQKGKKFYVKTNNVWVESSLKGG